MKNDRNLSLFDLDKISTINNFDQKQKSKERNIININNSFRMYDADVEDDITPFRMGIMQFETKLGINKKS